jgi:hypothetical protein
MAADREIQAMERIQTALDPLDPEARQRVLQWASGRFELAFTSQRGPNLKGGENEEGSRNGTGDSAFETFADLCHAAGPRTDPERALVGGYWLQVLGGANSFSAQPVNTELKQLGHAVGNITDALTALMERKPALVLQVQKRGKSKQARKVYKLTTPGIRRVNDMINGIVGDEE